MSTNPSVVNNNVMTLTLSVPALEKLWELGGEEFQLKLTNAVVQEFARRKIKAFISSDGMNNAINNAIKGEVADVTDGASSSYQWRTVIFNPLIKTALDDHASVVVREAKFGLINSTADRIKSAVAAEKAAIEDKIERAITAEVNRVVTEKVKARVAAIMAAAENIPELPL